MNSNLKKRCILIFPKFENIDIINEIREKYDPFASNVLPHITLVFPFDSNISRTELKDHLVVSLENIKCFSLTMQGIRKLDDSGFYLILQVTQGTEIIKELHEKLYIGLLQPSKPIWPKGFMPHMTVGLLPNSDELDTAYRDLENINEKFSAKIDTVSVEIIGENEDSIIELEVKLEG